MKILILAFAILASLSMLSFAASFSSINVTVSGSSAYITWSTDTNCSAQVLYGKTASYGSTTTNSTVSFSHGARLSGLSSGITYHYLLKCRINSTSSSNSSDQTFSTPEALPDLYVSSITSNPASPTLTQNISVKVTVKNKGAAAAKAVGVSLTCPGGELRSTTVSSVSASGSANSYFNCPPPQASGGKVISASVDVSNSIREGDETNNDGMSGISYSESPKPDLSVSDADITHAIQSSGNRTVATLKIYVSNIGNAKATDVWVKVADSNGVSTYKKMSSISPGSRGYVSITLPSSSGRFTITVDPNNTIAESNEGNNAATHEISASSSLPNILVLESGITHSPASPKTGDTVSITATIKNNGSVAAQNVRVRFVKVDKLYEYGESKDGESKESEFKEGKEGAGFGIMEDMIAESKMDKEGATSISVSGPAFANSTIASIPAGSSKTVRATIVMPPDTASMLIAVIADPDNSLSETSESDNIATHTISVQALYPDLSINESGISFLPESPEITDSMKVYASVKNNGALAAKNVPVRFYVSVNGGGYTLVKNANISSIAARGTGRADTSWTVPSGTLYARFMVDINNARGIVEKNYTNNNASAEFKTSLPDLKVTGGDVGVSGSVAVGSTVTIKANVSNIGTGKATSVPVGFYYVKSDGTDQLIGTKTATINAGSKSAQSIQWAVPSGISQNPIVFVQANPDKSIFEPDYGNNRGTVSLNAKLPDLDVSISASRQSATIPDSPSRTYYVPFTINVHNGGTDKAQNVLVRILKDGAMAKEQVVAQIAAGSSASVDYSFPVDSMLSPGVHEVSAVIDPAGTLTEATRDNNEDSAAITLARNQPPDAALNVDDANPMKYQWITFSCLNSTDPDSPASAAYYGCRWDYGDGSDIEYGYEVTHSYATSGTYNVKLNVTDYMGAGDVVHTSIIVQQNRLPVANAGGPYSAYTNEPVSLDPTSSYDPDGSIVSTDWIFGDGTHADGEGFWPMEHTYATPGTYTVALTVHDDSGSPGGTVFTQVYVTNPPPTSTKTGTEYYVSHHYQVEAGPTADMWYGTYRVDYELKYTQTDHVIKSLKYTITPGAAIVTAVTDSDAESLYMDMTAIARNGKTAMQVQGVEIRDGDGSVLWSDNGGPHVSGSESPRSMTYTGIDVQPPVWNDQNYVVINSEITYPGQMCAAEQFNCQDQAAVWVFP